MKEPADQVKDINIAKALYEKSCHIVNIDGKEIIQGLQHKEMVNESGDNEDSF